MSSTVKNILAEKQLNALLLTLNRHEKFNALTLDMVESLFTYFNKPGVKILHSSHKKAFCAGGDVVDLLKDDEKAKEFFRKEYHMNLALHNRKQSKDTVVIVDGICMGGGVGISAHAPFVVVTDNIKYAMPETKIGLHPDVGGSFFLPRMSSGAGLLLGLTGKTISSPWLLKEIGYAHHFVPTQRVPHLIKELCNVSDPNVIPGVIQEFSENPEPKAGDFKILEVANDCFRNNSLEEIFEALEEKPDCQLCKELLASLHSASPLSLHLTHRIYNLKANTLEEALKNEFRISSRLVKKGSDFHIGVNHLLVHKSKEPVKWTHESIHKVPSATVNEYFKPLEDDWKPRK